MSDIDQIALDVVKAISNIDPDKLPGGRTQALAQAQILVRDAINGEVEALKAANRDLQDWFDDARATTEKAQARVAELEESGDLVCDQLRQWQATERDEDSLAAMALWRRVRSLPDSTGFIFRKQAEAVEVFAEWVDPHWPKSQAIMIKDDARSHAFELRQQADKLEQTND